MLISAILLESMTLVGQATSISLFLFEKKHNIKVSTTQS